MNQNIKMIIFTNYNFQELIWYAEPSRDPAFTIALTRPLFIVLWNKNTTAQDIKTPKGFTVTYSLRGWLICPNILNNFIL